MDHHCPFLDCCIGYENHSSFILLILFGMAATVKGIVPIAQLLAQQVIMDIVYVTQAEFSVICLAFFMACSMLIFMLFLVYYQVGITSLMIVSV